MRLSTHQFLTRTISSYGFLSELGYPKISSFPIKDFHFWIILGYPFRNSLYMRMALDNSQKVQTYGSSGFPVLEIIQPNN